MTNPSPGSKWYDKDRHAAVRLGLALLFVATGCGGGDHGDKHEGVVLIPPYSGPLPTLEPPTTSPAGSTDGDQEIELVGTLTAPVAGCLVLDNDNGSWELTGELPDDLGPGDEVEVVGRVVSQDEGRCDAPVVRVQTMRILRSAAK